MKRKKPVSISTDESLNTNDNSHDSSFCNICRLNKEDVICLSESQQKVTIF